MVIGFFFFNKFFDYNLRTYNNICSYGFFFLGIFVVVSTYIEQKINTFTAIKFDYAGGSLCGNIKLYGEASARDFLRQVKRAQDEYK